MIHFDFIVTDLEAETIMDGLRELTIKALQQQMKAMINACANPTASKTMIDWTEIRLEFLEDLRNKMKNTKV